MRKLMAAVALAILFPAISALAAEDVTAPSPTPAKTAGNPAPTPVPPDPTIETDLRVTKDSGGNPNSYLIKNAPLPGDYVMGDNVAAPILLIEYASLSCPHCAHFSGTVLPELKKKYIDTGKMRYILRQFPLNEPALKGAELVECVGEQDKSKYFVFSKVLFDAQNKWAFDGNFLSGLETIATVGGLSKEQFHNCVSSTDREIQVLKEKKLANDELKVPHTPYMFINGEVYNGERSVEAMSQFIDSKLAAYHK